MYSTPFSRSTLTRERREIHAFYTLLPSSPLALRAQTKRTKQKRGGLRPNPNARSSTSHLYPKPQTPKTPCTLHACTVHVPGMCRVQRDKVPKAEMRVVCNLACSLHGFFHEDLKVTPQNSDKSHLRFFPYLSHPLGFSASFLHYFCV